MDIPLPTNSADQMPPVTPVAPASPVAPKPKQPSALKQLIAKIFATKKGKIIFFSVLGVIVLGGGGLVAYKILHKPAPAGVVVVPEPTIEPVTATKASLLTGEMLPSETVYKHPVAVMIENSPDARPQTGLINADVVYEALVEGSITRFMAVFSSDMPEKAGPVRSSRSYYLDWLADYDGFYAHAGGSPTALAKISEYGVKDYPHSNDVYWRIPQAGLASEHTLYVNVKKLYDNALSKRNWLATNDKIVSWKYAVPGEASATPISPKIYLAAPSYTVEWQFDPATKKYGRIMANTAHKDKTTGAQITATNVIAMQVTRTANAPYKDSGKESEWNQTSIGSGKAWVFRNGEKVEGTWKKSSRLERLKFYDSTNTEITLNPGKTWVEVISQTGAVN